MNFIREKKEQQQLMQEKLEASFPLLRERFLYRLVSGRLDADSVEKRKNYFQWKDQGGVFDFDPEDEPEMTEGEREGNAVTFTFTAVVLMDPV